MPVQVVLGHGFRSVAHECLHLLGCPASIAYQRTAQTPDLMEARGAVATYACSITGILKCPGQLLRHDLGVVHARRRAFICWHAWSCRAATDYL